MVTAHGYDPNFPDTRGLQKVDVEPLGLDYGDRFKSIFESSPYDKMKKGFEVPPDTIGDQLKVGLTFEPQVEIIAQPNEWHDLIMASFDGQVPRVKAMLRKGNVDVNVATKSDANGSLL